MLGSGFRTLLLIAVPSFCTALVLSRVPSPLISWESAWVLGVGVALFISLSLALASPWSSSASSQKAAFTFWWFLLISERLFLREGTAETEIAGQFAAAAYGEGIFWIISFLALIVISLRSPQYLRGLFSGHYKWVSFFGILCVLASTFSPAPIFALAWAFKLCLVILLLQLCSNHIHELRDITSFLRVTFWAYAFLVISPVIMALFGPSLFDEEGRMGTVVAADGLSAWAGTLVLLSLMLYSRARGVGLRKAAVIFGVAGFVIMILGGGKAAIVAGIFCGALFFLLRRGFGSALGYLSAALVFGCLLVLMSPLSTYLHVYNESGEGLTFTGRMPLWQAAVPLIRQKPILGHGYLASSFFPTEALEGIGSKEELHNMAFASHMHNGFLEVLYNNGLVGFFVILVIQVIIIKNLVHAIRRAPPAHYIYQIAIGCLALYANLLINGFFNASFGGRAWNPFMTLLSLVVVSDKLVDVLPSERLLGAIPRSAV